MSNLHWPIAIIDIGSNSIKLAVYENANPKRTNFNEKVACPLGANLYTTRRLNIKAKKIARHAIAGFMHLAKAFHCRSIYAIATAAIRESSDGAYFVQTLQRDYKVPIKIISGEQEARYSALSVLRYIQDARGVVADLGGGSLELARIANGHVYETMTFPLGTLCLPGHGRYLQQFIKQNLIMVSYNLCANLPLYAVGGTARAIASVDSQKRKKNLKPKSYSMTKSNLMNVYKTIRKMQPQKIVRKYDVELIRAKALPESCLLFMQIMKRLNSSKLIITSRGLRDGYLYSLVKRYKI